MSPLCHSNVRQRPVMSIVLFLAFFGILFQALNGHLGNRIRRTVANQLACSLSEKARIAETGSESHSSRLYASIVLYL